MFGKKHPPDCSCPDCRATYMSNSFSAFAAQVHAQAVVPHTSPFVGSLSRAAMLQALGIEEEEPEPEPTAEPRTVVGLVGYRLYTLDKELYLLGARNVRQTGRVSEQAAHKPDAEQEYVAGERQAGHLAPAWNCLCGFAAFYWPTALEKPAWTGVLAEVHAEGRTVMADLGWRAERIALHKLWVACSIMPDDALRTLQERYEVPVEVLR